MQNITGVWKSDNDNDSLLVMLTWKDNKEGGEGTLRLLGGQHSDMIGCSLVFVPVMPTRACRFVALENVTFHKYKITEGGYYTFTGVSEYKTILGNLKSQYIGVPRTGSKWA